ncbi:MAG: sensor histidine kinase [Eggerthella lenta]
MRELLDDLFSFAQVQDPSFEVACEPVRPADVLGDVLAGLYPQFCERGWEPRVLLDDEAVVQADAEALARIFRNLTANALRHGAAAPVIEQRGGRVTFANLVADPAAIDIDRLFERFYQGGGARSSAGRFGLGHRLPAGRLYGGHRRRLSRGRRPPRDRRTAVAGVSGAPATPAQPVRLKLSMQASSTSRTTRGAPGRTWAP